MAGFAFPEVTQRFLAELRADNDKDWFDAHRSDYQTGYVDAGKAFVEAVTPLLAELAPAIRPEPKVLGSIFRINRDTRFSADERPFKDHLDFWFWEGDRKSAVSGLFVRVTPEIVGIGAGCHGFDKTALSRYRSAVDSRLAALTASLRGAGYDLGGETYKKTPTGYDVAAGAEPLLRHSALFVHVDEPGSLASDGRLIDVCRSHWRSLLPLHRWLTEHVQRR